MNTLARLSKVEESLRKIVEEEGGLELELSKRRVKTVLRIADQLKEVVQAQRADLMAEMEAQRELENAARAEAIEAITQMAQEYGLDVKVLARKPSVAAPHPKVEATSKEIRAWAQANNFNIGDRGIIPRVVVEAYGLAHAS